MSGVFNDVIKTHLSRPSKSKVFNLLSKFDINGKKNSPHTELNLLVEGSSILEEP